MRLAPLLVFFISLTASNVHSLPLTVNGGWHYFEFPGVVNGVYPDYSWYETFDFSLTKPALLTVQDIGQDVDQFNVFDNNIFIGQTSNPSGGQFLSNSISNPDVAMTIPDFSSGIFLLEIGFHSITGDNIRYLSTDYGGGAFLRVDTISVPEPTTISLFIIVGILFILRINHHSSFFLYRTSIVRQ